jgi:hypothetical protein
MTYKVQPLETPQLLGHAVSRLEKMHERYSTHMHTILVMLSFNVMAIHANSNSSRRASLVFRIEFI